jgi:EAL domain-containing protein (putative c-di-GMP-specific phosphodiesterase class I)
VAGRQVPRMPLAVNVSARQLHQRDFTGMVEQILETG